MTVQTNGFHDEEPKRSSAMPAYPSATNASTQPITVMLTAEEISFLAEVGKDNPSEGVRIALRALRAQQAELKRIIAGMEATPASVVAQDELQRRLAQKKASLHAVAP